MISRSKSISPARVATGWVAGANLRFQSLRNLSASPGGSTGTTSASATSEMISVPCAAARWSAAIEAEACSGSSSRTSPAGQRYQPLRPSRVSRRYSSTDLPAGRRPRPRHFSKGFVADFFHATSTSPWACTSRIWPAFKPRRSHASRGRTRAPSG